jgi:post-segregation antitoxin (ccd killing protein)
MQHLNTLWQAVNVASSVTELARQSQTYHFNVSGAVTFYLQAESAAVRVTRWNEPKVEVTAQLQAAFGWRVATDQDDAGVYVVARRRPVVGTLSSALFSVLVPLDAYLIFKLADGRVTLNHIDGTLQVPPLESGGATLLLKS